MSLSSLRMDSLPRAPVSGHQAAWGSEGGKPSSTGHECAMRDLGRNIATLFFCQMTQLTVSSQSQQLQSVRTVGISNRLLPSFCQVANGASGIQRAMGAMAEGRDGVKSGIKVETGGGQD